MNHGSPTPEDISRIREIMNAIAQRDADNLNALVSNNLTSVDDLWAYLDRSSTHILPPGDDFMSYAEVFQVEDDPNWFNVSLRFPSAQRKDSDVVLTLDFFTDVVPHRVVFRGVIAP